MVSRMCSFTSGVTLTVQLILLLIVAYSHTESFSSCSVPNYRVISVAVPGFLEVNSNANQYQSPYAGFLIDLLDAMARVGRFTYTLKLAGEGEFGHLQSDGCFNGAVGALVSSNVDIVASMVESVLPYQNVIDFTTAFFQSNVQVLYNTRTGLEGTYYAVLASSATRDFLQSAKDSRLQSIWANILAYLPQSLPNTYDEAIRLVTGGGWALIGRTPAIDNAVARSNGLLAKDPTVLRKVFAGFAVQKGSPLRHKLNVIVNELQDDGTMDTLLNKHFPFSKFACQ